jgi:hypothetical protein
MMILPLQFFFLYKYDDFTNIVNELLIYITKIGNI